MLLVWIPPANKEVYVPTRGKTVATVSNCLQENSNEDYEYVYDRFSVDEPAVHREGVNFETNCVERSANGEIPYRPTARILTTH